MLGLGWVGSSAAHSDARAGSIMRCVRNVTNARADRSFAGMFGCTLPEWYMRFKELLSPQMQAVIHAVQQFPPDVQQLLEQQLGQLKAQNATPPQIEAATANFVQKYLTLVAQQQQSPPNQHITSERRDHSLMKAY